MEERQRKACHMPGDHRQWWRVIRPLAPPQYLVRCTACKTEWASRSRWAASMVPDSTR